MKKATGHGVLFPKLSYKVMEAVFEVHNELGPGFSEGIYENASAIELEAQEISFEQQKPIEVYYKGHALGTYRLDIVVDNRIILELKAVSELSNVHKQQVLSYLKATDLRLGILINFGGKRVQYARIAN